MNFIVIIILLIKISVIKSFVRIKDAQIYGFKKQVLGKKLNVYLGIPYAQPPIGELRFQKPLPLKLVGKIDATKWPKPCWQIDGYYIVNLENRNYSEDCLYLNIWAPKSKQLKPVLVWIHGGGLIGGSSNDLSYEGDVLASQAKVVIVSMNYRLDVFGFLFADSDEMPGNVGLYDQMLALKWVQNNIKYFCGDPKRVTIIGQSAGGRSVSGHFLSPESRHLFNNAIDISGSQLAEFGNADRATTVSMSFEVAKQVKCAASSATSFNQMIIKCLKKLQPNEFFKSQNPFRTVVYGTEFFPDKPVEMLKAGNYKRNSELLVGIAENEGNKHFVNETEIEMPRFSKEDARRIIDSNEELAGYNTDEIYKFYISTIPDGHLNALRKATTLLVGDVLTSCPTIDFGRLVFENDKNSRVFGYYYTYKHNLKLLEEIHFSFTDLCKPYKGACHAFDLVSLFGWPLKRPDKFSAREKQLSKRMIETVASFSRFGRPARIEGVEWPVFYSDKGTTAMPYYEFASKDFPQGNFKWNLKEFECQDLFKKIMEL